MHYAEFAEDEVQYQFKKIAGLSANVEAEPGITQRYQRVRGKQVEGDRRQSWQTCQGTNALVTALGLQR